MTSERWQKVKAVLEDALEQEEPQRTAFVDSVCDGDEDLRREVVALLTADSEVGDFIEKPIFRIRFREEALSEGHRIGPYRIVRELGHGGMGRVYLAERADDEFRQKVALKVLKRGMDTDEIVRRFRREHDILANLNHENIATLFLGDSTPDGRPYFAMEYVEGLPIDQYFVSKALPLRDRLKLFQKVCSAVHLAHQNLVVHRDLKPSNILVTDQGIPKLLDFGIAKLLEEGADSLATRMELRPMTPEYASPEQALGKVVTTQSDVYSLGVLLYGLLTGQRPYKVEPGNQESLVKAISEVDPPRPSSVSDRPELAGDLDKIILKAMEKEPERRYASVDQFSNDIGRYLDGLPVIAQKPTLAYRTSKFVRRHSVGVSVAAAVMMLIIGSGIVATVLWQRAVREQQRAEEVSGFLEEVFTASNPRQSLGREVTARELLDQGFAKIDDRLRAQPEVRAELMSTMGRAYRSIGRYEQAKELLAESLRLRRQLFGNNDLRVANTSLNLAFVLRELEDNEAAEPLIRDALRIQRQHGETQNLNHAAGLSHLGALLQAEGDLNEAEALFQESLQIKRQLPDADLEDMAFNLNSLGQVYEAQRKLEKAEEHYKKALDIRRRLHPGDHPDVATSLNDFASWLESNGDLAGAENLNREALAMRQRLYGKRSTKAARSHNNLGFVLLAQGNADAEEHFRQALSILDESPSPNKQSRAFILRNLSSALILSGKFKEAEMRAREALKISKASQTAPWHAPVAESVLGSSLAAQGRFQEAEPLLLRSYEFLQKDKTGGASYVKAARQRLVDLYTAWGKPEKAALYQSRP